MRMNQLALAAGLGLIVAMTAGCPVYLDGLPNPNSPVIPASTNNRAPVIAAFDYSPKTGVTKNDAITFTVVATSANGEPLQYNWSSTKGTLSGNTGMTVSWRPTKADGAIEPGLTAITVIVSDGRQTSVGTVNVSIDAEGKAVVQDTVVPTPAPVMSSPAPTTAPTMGPTAAPTMAPTAAPTAAPATAAPVDSDAINGTVLFEDGFDGSNGDFNLWAPYDSYGGLKWKVIPGGAQGSRSAAIANDAEDEVKSDTSSLNRLAFADSVDLTTAAFPRVRFYVKNTASPGSSVTFTALWASDGGYNTEIAPAFSGTKDWGYKDFNLAPFKGKSGKLTLEVNVKGANAKFAGPMVDNITIYDAAK